MFSSLSEDNACILQHDCLHLSSLPEGRGWRFKKHRGLLRWVKTDTVTDILPDGSASCVQNFDDSRFSRIA